MQEALEMKLVRRTFKWERRDIEKLILEEVRKHLEEDDKTAHLAYKVSSGNIKWNDVFEDEWFKKSDNVVASIVLDVEELNE